jgi:hypothetical protein
VEVAGRFPLDAGFLFDGILAVELLRSSIASELAW